MSKIEKAADAAGAMGAILAALASGHVTPGEAEGVTKFVEGFVKALEASPTRRLTSAHGASLP